jgi:hypothetical protein
MTGTEIKEKTSLKTYRPLARYSDPQMDWTNNKPRIWLRKTGIIMEEKAVKPLPIQRWTTKRKKIIVKLLKGHKTAMDLARRDDLKQGGIQQWIDTFVEFGREGLKYNPRKVEAIYPKELKRHRERISELICQIDVFGKKRINFERFIAGEG